MRRAPFIVVLPFVAGTYAVGCEKESTGIIRNPAPPVSPEPAPAPPPPTAKPAVVDAGPAEKIPEKAPDIMRNPPPPDRGEETL